LTVKADAHFVDCDINPLTAEEWVNDGEEYPPARYPNTVVADGPEAVVLDTDYQELAVLNDDGDNWTGIRSVDIDRDGNYALGPTANNVNEPMVVLYDSDGTELYRDYPHPHTTGGNIDNIRFSKDSTYVMALNGWGIQKWKMSDRTLVFETRLWRPTGAEPHPTNDEYIICSSSPYDLDHPDDAWPCILDGDGEVVLQWSDFGGYSYDFAGYFAPSRRIVCSLTHAFFCVHKPSEYDFPILYKMSLTDADDTTYFHPTPADKTTDGQSIYLYGDYVYFLSIGTTNANLWKLKQSDLSVDASATINSNAISIWIDRQARLGIKWNSSYTGHTQHIDLYDVDDLSFIESIDCNTTETFAGATYPYDVHNIPSYLRPTFGPATPNTSVQKRTVAYPQDYSHLEGETVQVLADGIYLDDNTYTIASGAVSPTYTATTDHVGLRFDSKLQPMKIDGEVNVKRISKLIPDVYESVGGDYGKELTDLYTMVLRDTNDPMDIDGALYTGYLELPYKGQYDRQGDIWIVQDEPLPMTLLGVGIKASVEAI
jgi:hypothetical protein